MADSHSGKFSIVTGASTGIGLELAKCCARDGMHLLIAADEPQIHEAAEELRALGAASVEAVEADLSDEEGVDQLIEAARGRVPNI
jgi:NAD(P)-dependent dehydrogenase (short-subunit alcohol dehydrogenase family)